jgi:DNA replication protein DnaD
MAFDSTMVFPFDKDYKTFEREVGETMALKMEVELLRSVLMENGKRDIIKKAEKEMYKRYAAGN